MAIDQTQNTLSGIHQSEPNSQESRKELERTRNESDETVAPVPQVEALLEECDTEYSYYLVEDDQDKIEHVIAKNNTPVITLREIVGKYLLYYDHDGNISSTNPREYRRFELAFAALIETVEMEHQSASGPNIWEYNGFTDDEKESFIAYLAGENNTECGSHRLTNTEAGYSISLETYHSRSTEESGTKTVLTIFTHEDDNSTTPIYRNSFDGQKQAFEYLFQILSTPFSKRMHHHGPTHSGTVPSVETLIT